MTIARAAKLVELLLEKGADVNKVNDNGRKPIDSLPASRDYASIRRILEEHIKKMEALKDVLTKCKNKAFEQPYLDYLNQKPGQRFSKEYLHFITDMIKPPLEPELHKILNSVISESLYKKDIESRRILCGSKSALVMPMPLSLILSYHPKDKDAENFTKALRR